MAIGVNSLFGGVGDIAFGNLMGGIIILFGLILGLSAVLNRRISTNGKIGEFSVLSLYFILPVLFALDGEIKMPEGLALIFLYLVIIIYLYTNEKRTKKIKNQNSPERESKIFGKFLLFVSGIILVVIFSNLIVRLTVEVLKFVPLSSFFTGLVLFSIGTNLPEIIVTLRSWRRKIKDLSVSNLIGSGMANILILGVFASFKNLSVMVDLPFFLFFIFLLVLMALLLYFSSTGRALIRKEGMILVIIYFAFFVFQFIFASNLFLK